MVIPEKAAPNTETTLRTTGGPLCRGLSAVNAIGMQLRDLIDMGPDGSWQYEQIDAFAESGRNHVGKHQIQPACRESAD